VQPLQPTAGFENQIAGADLQVALGECGKICYRYVAIKNV
jgi:hypothetical protein